MKMSKFNQKQITGQNTKQKWNTDYYQLQILSIEKQETTEECQENNNN